MRKVITNIYLGVALSGILMTGCVATNPIGQTPLKSIPESFSGKKDSTNSASVNWKSYFSDPILVGLIDTALQNNLDLRMAAQKIEIARANVKFSNGLALPTGSVTGSAGQQKFGDYTMDAAGNRGTTIYNNQAVPKNLQDFNLGFVSSWEVDFWGKLKNTRKSAVAQYLSSVEGKNWTVTNLVAEVASGYYELLALDNELDIISESIQLQDSALHVVNIQRQVGVVNELAVKQFEAQVLNSKKMEIDTQQKISQTENRLNFLLGRYPQPIARTKSAFSHLVPPQVKIGIPANLLENRPDVKQAEYDLLASKANVKMAKAAFYPTISISASVGREAFKTSLLTSPESFAYNVAGNLVAPLINRSALKAQFRSATAAQTEALYNYQKSILNSYMEVYNEMVNLKSVEKALDLKSKEVNTLNQAVTSSNQLFKTGRANYLEVLTVQANVLQSKIELVETMKDQYTSVVSIYKALGGGWK
jgi:NodT family efflux transporter outer membrane factor (OMF) lipoprotein